MFLHTKNYRIKTSTLFDFFFQELNTYKNQFSRREKSSGIFFTNL